MKSLEREISSVLRYLEKPSRYIGGEFNSPNISTEETNQNFNFCFVYPDVYEVGFPNQAMRILCNAVNDMDGFIAQRAFLPMPNAIDAFKNHDIPLYSLETKSPLKEFDAIGITVSHELAATNVLEVLDFAGIDVHSKKREECDPIIFGGGPMCCNPEPFADFFDVIVIGEAEIVLCEALRLVAQGRKNGMSRFEILKGLINVDGMYIPSFYQIDQADGNVIAKYDYVPNKVTKTLYRDFSDTGAYSNCLVPFVEATHDRLNVEVLRGCARGCRFCQAGMMYRPVRERNCIDICNAVEKGLTETGYDEVSLTSLSTTDHSEIEEILSNLNERFRGKDIRISIPSQRLDRFGVEMAKLVSGNKKGGLTFAIEAGSQRLRDVINKNVCEDDLFSAIKSSFSQGWNRCKLYFMIGLPSETDDDIVAIADLCEKVYSLARESVEDNRKSAVAISASVAVFVPKAQTPFQWDGIINPDEALRRVKLIRQNLKSRAIKLSYHDPYTSTIEALISRGGREVSDIIFSAWKNGAKFDSWNEFFDFDNWNEAASDCCQDLFEIACSNYQPDRIMPWEHVSLGIDRDFLVKEKEKSLDAITTPDCTFDKCQNCGVCQNLNCKNITSR